MAECANELHASALVSVCRECYEDAFRRGYAECRALLAEEGRLMEHDWNEQDVCANCFAGREMAAAKRPCPEAGFSVDARSYMKGARDERADWIRNDRAFALLREGAWLDVTSSRWPEWRHEAREATLDIHSGGEDRPNSEERQSQLSVNFPAKKTNGSEQP